MSGSPHTIHELATPALLLDLEILEANLRRMADRAAALHVALRPHIKTHKCVEIAERQRASGAVGITVSTLYEARVFARHGFDDITWAFPVILGRIPEAVCLADRVRLGLTADSPEAVEALEATGRALRVWLEVDCGHGRSGVDPSAAEGVELARRIHASSTLSFAGILTHSGHAYGARSPEEAAAVAEEERSVMVAFASRLRDRDIDVPEVSVGSTPAMSRARSLEGVTEARPGNYAFHDHTQTLLGSCGVGDCALTVLSSVVSRGRDHAVVDAGALALSKDTGPAWSPTHYGRVFSDEGAASLRDDVRVTSVSQEHGILDRPLAVGTRVRILPNHSCLTAANFDRYHVVRGEEVVDAWAVWRGRD